MDVLEFDFHVYERKPDGNYQRLDLETSKIAAPWVARWMVFAGVAARNAGGDPDAATHLHRWISAHPDLENIVCQDYWVPVSPHHTLDDFQKHAGAQMRDDILVRTPPWSYL
jgi:hypothetical protein